MGRETYGREGEQRAAEECELAGACFCGRVQLDMIQQS